uniref:VWA domain-containing protein n=1 Tax=Schlesneria paludicola TaxID=360056 RepID=A0A7C2P4C6_9PLAN
MTWSTLLGRWLAAAALLAATFSGSRLSAADAKPPSRLVTGEQAVQWLSKGSEPRKLIALESLRWNSPHDAAYTRAIIDGLTDAAGRRTIPPSQFRATRVLAGSPLPEADVALQRLLTAVDWRLQMTAADALGERGTESAASPLLQCWSTPAAVENYALRHAVVCALGDLKGTQGLDGLIRLLPELDGQLRYEAVSRLMLRTGENRGDKTEEWVAWQSGRDPNWSGRIVTDDLPAEIPWNRVLPRFFRVPIYAKRVLFVVDMSGSMKSTVEGKTRLEATQDELTNAIKALPEDSLFGVIAFNDRVQPWHLQPMVATSENKQAAIRAIWTLSAQGRTAINDALETALGYSGYLEQILLLSDGKPTAGKLVDNAAIIANITGRNEFRRVRIDTIGLDSSGEAERLLEQLSEQNHGQYHKLR